jgi:hypothetical protein
VINMPFPCKRPMTMCQCRMRTGVDRIDRLEYHATRALPYSALPPARATQQPILSVCCASHTLAKHPPHHHAPHLHAHRSAAQVSHALSSAAQVSHAPSTWPKQTVSCHCNPLNMSNEHIFYGKIECCEHCSLQDGRGRQPHLHSRIVHAKSAHHNRCARWKGTYTKSEPPASRVFISGAARVRSGVAAASVWPTHLRAPRGE